jgi:hypothetical protein
VPAAAVIPAPIAYIKVVAVKKLVVGFLSGRPANLTVRACVDQDILQ